MHTSEKKNITRLSKRLTPWTCAIEHLSALLSAMTCFTWVSPSTRGISTTHESIQYAPPVSHIHTHTHNSHEWMVCVCMRGWMSMLITSIRFYLRRCEVELRNWDWWADLLRNWLRNWDSTQISVFLMAAHHCIYLYMYICSVLEKLESIISQGNCVCVFKLCCSLLLHPSLCRRLY